jgi:hypothetical protein
MDTTEIKRFQVLARGGRSLGIFLATCAQAARDACAIDAGYRSEAEMVEQIDQPSELVARDVTNVLLAIPGHAQQVYNGWIWVTPGEVEHSWSRGATREQCEHEILLAVERLGVDNALDLEPAE